jgi:hypothetical protein
MERLGRLAREPVGEVWVLLGALGLIVTVAGGDLGSGARLFRPDDVDPTGPLAWLVRAADLAWDPAVLRASAVVAGILVALAAIATAGTGRGWRPWAAVGLTALVVGLMTVPGVALQAGLRQASAPWFHTNDSTYQIELGGGLVRRGDTPYGHDYRYSGLERFYTRDGTASDRVRDRQVALLHFAYFPGTPLSAAAWGLLPEPWSDYRFLVLLATLAAGASALLFRGSLAWRLALGALIAASPVAIKSAWFGQADAPALLCLVLAFALAARKRWVWCAVLLALAVLLKQFALFAVPFLALLILQRGGGGQLLRAGIAFAVVAAAGFLPFLISDPGAVWEDTVEYGGSIYRIIGYGLAPLLLKVGVLDDRFGGWPFPLLALLVWLPLTLLLLRWQWRSGELWPAAAGFAASIYLVFFLARVFQETYLIWPLTAIALAALLYVHQRATGTGLEPVTRAAPPATATAA